MKKKILIVDDDPDILDAMSLILENENFEIEATLNGKSLLKKSSFDSDLILLDKRLSGIDGIEICKFLKAGETTKDIPVIMISAVSNIDELAEEAGADDFIEKPFNIRDLLDKVEKHIFKVKE